jgi:hypothetical protein
MICSTHEVPTTVTRVTTVIVSSISGPRRAFENGPTPASECGGWRQRVSNPDVTASPLGSEWPRTNGTRNATLSGFH